MASRTRLLYLFLALFVAALCSLAVGPVCAQQAENRITLDLKDANLEDALRLIFRPPFSFTLEPGVTGRVTVSLHDVTFSQALRAILDLNHLTYTKEADNVYVIKRREETAPTTPTTPPPTTEIEASNLPLFWIGPGGRYELQALDSRDIAAWFGFGNSTINPLPIPYSVGTPGGGGIGGGYGGGGLGGGLGGGIGGGIGGIGTGGLGSSGVGTGGLGGLGSIGGVGTGGIGSGSGLGGIGSSSGRTGVSTSPGSRGSGQGLGR